MEVLLITDLRGRIRVELKHGLSANDFENLASGIARDRNIKYLSFNPLTRRLLILFNHSQELRLFILENLEGFEPSNPKESYSTDNIVLSTGIEIPLPTNPIYPALIKRLLPRPIRYFLTLVDTLPHLWSGLVHLLKRRKLTVEVLDASAISVLLARRDFASAGTLTFFLALSDYLAAWTKQKSLTGLFQSLDRQTEKIWIIDETGHEVLVTEPEIKTGTLVVARSGGLVAVDGIVTDGEAMVNQATMTGEALAVLKDKGAPVFAGTSVESGRIVIRADKVGSDTRIRSIVRYIRDSEASKASLTGRAEHLAEAIVPFNFLLCALVFLITRDPIKTGNVLLVDYSCAIRLATPLAVLSAMREGTELGLLIKGGRYLEELARADTVVFDKTGTLTCAKPRVSTVVSFKPFSRTDVLRLAACLEEHFPHPVGRAVVRLASQEGLGHEEEHTEVNYVMAHGISSTWRGHRVLLGSRHFIIDDEKIKISPEQTRLATELASRGASLIYLTIDENLAALLVINDHLRPRATKIVSALRTLGLSRAIMLTGDLEQSARSMAEKAGFDEYHSELLPEEKTAYINQLVENGHYVIMVGDGINDSAALSRAHAGVALCDASDLARDVANIQLLDGNLFGLALARVLSQKATRRISGNYRLIVGANSLFLVMGLIGLAGPSLITLLHNATTALVSYLSTRPFIEPWELEKIMALNGKDNDDDGEMEEDTETGEKK